MNAINKVSDITYEDIASYIKIDLPLEDEEKNLLNNLINISKNFIVNYTGKKLEELDNYSDFIIVVLILCQDMYDTRNLYVDKTNMNKVVETILGMHSENLL